MNKYDKERALCKENMEKIDKQIAMLRKRKSEWATRLDNANKDEKLSLIAKSEYNDPDKLAEKLGVTRDEEIEEVPTKEKSPGKIAEFNVNNDNLKKEIS